MSLYKNKPKTCDQNQSNILQTKQTFIYFTKNIGTPDYISKEVIKLA